MVFGAAQAQDEERYYVVGNSGGDEEVFNLVTENVKHTHLIRVPFSAEGNRTVAADYDYQTADVLFNLTYDQHDA